MEEKNKNKVANRIFYIILTLLIFGSVGATYYRIVWQKDYQILSESSCDPLTEQGCYVWICDPVDDKTCPADEAERISYYKLISKKASSIALCEASEEKLGCDEELTCLDDEEDCSYAYCDPANLAEGEACAE